MKKRGTKQKKYYSQPTTRKVIITLLALILGDILFAYSATLPNEKPMASLFFSPAVISTSILLAAATYFITSFVKE